MQHSTTLSHSPGGHQSASVRPLSDRLQSDPVSGLINSNTFCKDTKKGCKSEAILED